MSKYRPLSDRLSRHDGDEWRATFAQIEEALGFPLPRSARVHRPWWGNEAGKNRPQARAWMEGGWRVVEVDQLGEIATFRREHASQVAPTPVVEVASGEPAEQDQAKPARGATALIGGAVAGLGMFAVKMLKGRKA